MANWLLLTCSYTYSHTLTYSLHSLHQSGGWFLVIPLDHYDTNFKCQIYKKIFLKTWFGVLGGKKVCFSHCFLSHFTTTTTISSLMLNLAHKTHKLLFSISPILHKKNVAEAWNEIHPNTEWNRPASYPPQVEAKMNMPFTKYIF